jgi:SAM-dependent methyltransferase
MRPPEFPDVETSSAGYAQRFAGAVGRWFLDRQARCTAELLGRLAPGARVLDVGGGHAQLVPVILAAGGRVTVFGSDATCGGRLAAWIHTGEVRFETGDVMALPYADASFDVVLGYRLLTHVPEWPRLVSELCRVSARRVIVDYPSRRSVNVLADRLFEMKKRVEGDTRHFTLFSPGDVARAFAANGFAVTGERGQFFLPMAFHRALNSAAAAKGLEWLPHRLGLTRALGSPRIVRADRRIVRP